MAALAVEYGPEGGSNRRGAEALRGFGPLIVASLIAHALVVAGAVAYLGWTARPRVDLESLPVELVSLGTPRDPELLPRKVKAPPPGPKPQLEGAPAPSEEGVAIEGKAPDASKAEAAPRPKRKTRKRERKLSSEARRLLAGGPDRELDEAIAKVEAAEGRPDGFVGGTTTDPSAAANAYEARVKALLQARYELPLTVQAQRRFLQAVVVLYIDRRGHILRHEFVERHASQPFMNALEKLLSTVELPPPPKELVSTYRTEGLAIRFKP